MGENLDTQSQLDKTSENAPDQIILDEKDLEKVKRITSGVNVVPEEIRDKATEDVLKTLENQHPLNKIWRDENGEIIGFLAFEDFVPKEAYAKYLATEGLKGENPFSLIPKLVQKAKEAGYTKLHFHGWNPRLNKVLEHFGFIKTHTDKVGEHSADHFELNLEKDKKPELDEKIKEAFEQKYKLRLIRETQETVRSLGQEKQKQLDSLEQDLVKKLAEQEGFDLTDQRKMILKLKLARYLQRNNSLDVNTLTDAIIETPKFLDKDKGGFDRLLEIHEQKTLEKIAEMRKRKAEQKDGEGFNPYEALFQTSSGKYYMTRLLNMPHLEEESQYMKHCVGTSDSYINKMKRGDVEILSFRKAPTINKETQKLEGDEPIITIEYNVRTKTIEQIKKHSDQYLSQNDPFYLDFIEALRKLKDTENDSGKKRDFRKINESELENFKVKDYHLLTENGEVSFKDFDPDSDTFVLKMGKMNITKEIPKVDAAKIFKIVEGLEIEPEKIAYNEEEVNENTIAYVGKLYPNIFKQLPQNIEHVYTSFPENRVYIKEIEIPNELKSAEQYEKELIEQGFSVGDWGKDILYKADLKQGRGQKIKLIIPTVEALGFPNGGNRQEIQNAARELGIGLKPLPPIVGPELRKQYKDQSEGEYIAVDMENITDRPGYPLVFRVDHHRGKHWLDAYYGEADRRWYSFLRWAFSQD